NEDGRNLLAGYKRATNIIRIEEKKDNRHYTGAPQAKLYRQPEEKALAGAIEMAETEAGRAVKKEDFVAAMRAMATLRPAVDAFFDKVTAKVDDRGLRESRLKLHNQMGEATREVAVFSKIGGCRPHPGPDGGGEPGIHTPCAGDYGFRTRRFALRNDAQIFGADR